MYRTFGIYILRLQLMYSGWVEKKHNRVGHAILLCVWKVFIIDQASNIYSEIIDNTFLGLMNFLLYTPKIVLNSVRYFPSYFPRSEIHGYLIYETVLNVVSSNFRVFKVFEKYYSTRHTYVSFVKSSKRYCPYSLWLKFFREHQPTFFNVSISVIALWMSWHLSFVFVSRWVL